MSIYKYPESKVIDEITFKKTGKGTLRAYLHACPDVPREALDDALATLMKEGLECIPYTLDGKPALEVRGFKNQAQFIAMLSKNKFTSGNLDLVKEKEDFISWRDKLKERSLQASGLFYVIGDVNFMGYGHKEKHLEDILAGVMYAGGTASLLGFGRNDQSNRQVRELSKDIMHHLMDAGVKLPEDHSLHHLVEDKKKTLFENVHDTFEHYPSEMFNMFLWLAGACITTSALRHKVLKTPSAHMDIQAIKAMRHEGWLDVGLGSMTMASTMWGFFANEKAPDPNAPQPHGVKATLEWAKEHPLAVSAAGLMASTLFHAVSTLKAYNEIKRTGDIKRMGAIINRAAFVATNVAAEFLIAVSSKGHGEGVVSDKSVDTSAIAVAAELIAKQPQDLHEQLIDYMGNFLGQQKVLAMDKNEVFATLRKQVQDMSVNPWAKANGDPVVPPLTLPSLAIAKADMPTWKTKVASGNKGESQLQPTL